MSLSNVMEVRLKKRIKTLKITSSKQKLRYHRLASMEHAAQTKSYLFMMGMTCWTWYVSQQNMFLFHVCPCLSDVCLAILSGHFVLNQYVRQTNNHWDRTHLQYDGAILLLNHVACISSISHFLQWHWGKCDLQWEQQAAWLVVGVEGVGRRSNLNSICGKKNV